jgi:hypothetical protein
MLFGYLLILLFLCVFLGFIHPREFRGRKIMKYIDHVRLRDPKVKGRHSNETWLDTWEDTIMRHLNVRLAIQCHI